MSVPIGMKFTATVNVAVPQLVRCVHCETKFIYMMKRSGKGTADSFLFIGMDSARAEAENRARGQIEAALHNPEAFDPVPCPKCFKYQPYMREKVAQIQYANLGCLAYCVVGLGVTVMLIAGIWAYFSKNQHTPAVIGLSGLVALLLGGLLVVRQMRLVTKYDPTEHDLYNRKVAASTWAKSLDDFNTHQASLVRDQYQKHACTPDRKQRRPPERRPASIKNPWSNSPPEPGGDELVLVWWVLPSVFLNGGIITITLSERVQITVQVPEDAEPGTAFDLQHCPAGVIPFKVCVLPIYVHRDEYRLE